jgi:hypothetical protein
MAWELFDSPTCLPNGRASTRCSGFRPNSFPFEPSLYRLRSPLPGNGIFRAEKKRSIRPLNHRSAVSETKQSYKDPPIRGLSQPLQEISITAGMRGGPGIVAHSL